MMFLYCDINWEQNIVGEPLNELEKFSIISVNNLIKSHSKTQD